MKKIFSVTIILEILIFSACVPAFAEEYIAGDYTTPNTFGDYSSDVSSDIIYSDRALDELPPDRVELTDEEKLTLVQDYLAQLGLSDAPENYTVLCFKTLSNSMSLVFVEPKDWIYNDLLAMESIGKYLYRHGDGRSVKLYQNGVYTEFSDAYKSGMIDDAVLEEINDVMHFDRYAEQTVTTQPVEEATQPAEETTQPAEETTVAEETAESTTASETEPATLSPASKDTPDSSVISSGSIDGKPVATGENSAFTIVIAIALTSILAGAFAAAKMRS